VDSVQERIKYYTELFKVLWLTLVADIGGTVSVALGSPWRGKWIVVISGAVLGLAIFSIALVLHFTIERLIRTREEENA